MVAKLFVNSQLILEAIYLIEVSKTSHCLEVGFDLVVCLCLFSQSIVYHSAEIPISAGSISEIPISHRFKAKLGILTHIRAKLGNLA